MRALVRVATLACVLAVPSAGAQVTGTATFVSDYRYRGVSLSDDKPAAQLSVVYDDPAGWYAGVFGSTVQLYGESSIGGQAIGFAGFTRPLAGGVHWDVGGDYAVFTSGRDYDYGEIYTGLATDRASVRVHYSPDYFGLGFSSVYSEANASYPLTDGVALLGHVGVLVLPGHTTPASVPGARHPVDGRVGVAFDVVGFNLQVAWSGTNGSGYGYPVYRERRNTFVVSVSWAF